MPIRPSRRRLPAWIAALALLLATFAPALMQGLAGGQGASWVEVCSADGARWVSASGADAPAGPAVAHGLEHCPCCPLHAVSLGLPTAPGCSVPAPVAVAFVAPASRAAPRTLPPWVSAPPRAPPRRA